MIFFYTESNLKITTFFFFFFFGLGVGGRGEGAHGARVSDCFFTKNPNPKKKKNLWGGGGGGEECGEGARVSEFIIY